MSDVGCCRSRKLALSLTSLREVGVAAARRTPFRGPWQKPPFVRAYAVGQGAVTPPRSQATLCNHAPGMPTPASEDFITASSSTSVPSAHCPKDRDP